MNLLQKNPAPWSVGYDGVVYVTVQDANGQMIVELDDFGDGLDVVRGVLAIPVLIESLEVAVSESCPRDLTPFNLLISWLKGDDGAPEVNMGEFLKWLRGGEGKILKP